MPSNSQYRSLMIWLFSLFLMVGFMVIVGGITRLTRSGLSIVEWKPFSGVIPPITQESWELEFEKYKQFPEYKMKNREMSLSEFKFIFFWEFTHRLLGRLIGFIFLIPFIYFYLKKYFEGALFYKIGFAFILGGLQGFMGWFMVKSGLVDIPRVSHYRLAAHLLLALFIMMYLFWIILEIYFTTNEKTDEAQNPSSIAKLRKTSWIVSSIITIQILYGAFTAGIRAGYVYNTFPLMGVKWFPDELFQMDPPWINFFENMIMVQFIHRSLGWLTLFSAVGFLFYSRKFPLRSFQKKGIAIFIFMISLQFILGIITIIYAVPVSVGVLHQMGAMLLLTASVYVNFSFTSKVCLK